MKRFLGNGALWLAAAAAMSAVLAAIFMKKADSGDGDMESIRQAVRNFSGDVGIYAKNLRTGRELSVYPDEVFITSSTNKLIAAMGIYKYLYDAAEAPTQERLAKTVECMLRYADPNAYFESLATLRTCCGGEMLQRLMREDFGLTFTQADCPESMESSPGFGITTARELGKVFELLYVEQYLGQVYSRRLLGFLVNPSFNDMISRYFPSETVIHKAGAFGSSRSDVGVVQSGKAPVLISIYAKTEQSESVAANFIAGISTLLVRELAAETTGNRL